MGGIVRGKVIFTLVILIILGMVLGSLHNRSLNSGKPFFAHDIVRTVLTPVNIISRGVLSIGNSVLRIGRPRKSLLKENAMLRKETQRLMKENAKLREASEENVHLRNALEMKRSVPIQMLASEVISRKESSWFDTATIDRGRTSGVKEGSAVVT
jgi:rod shape-determining protein MreC